MSYPTAYTRCDPLRYGQVPRTLCHSTRSAIPVSPLRHPVGRSPNCCAEHRELPRNPEYVPQKGGTGPSGEAHVAAGVPGACCPSTDSPGSEFIDELDMFQVDLHQRSLGRYQQLASDMEIFMVADGGTHFGG